MGNLKQNTLAEATTELGFVKTINENAGETVVALEKEVELETGEVVTVAGITPEKMKTVLNNGADPEIVTFKTPGENVEEIKGVCQVYNETIAVAEPVVYNMLEEEIVPEEETATEETATEETATEETATEEEIVPEENEEAPVEEENLEEAPANENEEEAPVDEEVSKEEE